MSFHQVDDDSGSKMDIKNLATVIAPNILYTNSKTPTLDSDPIFAIVAVEDLINYIEEMCLVRNIPKPETQLRYAADHLDRSLMISLTF